MATEIVGQLYAILAAHPLLAPVLFIQINMFMAAALLPCSPMPILAGLLWGERGVVIAIAGGIASCATTFLLSRTFLRHRIERFLQARYPRGLNVLMLASEHDWKIIALAQLNPLLPSTAAGYAFGLSRISFRRYIFFATIFMIPLQVLYVMTGNSLAGLFSSRDTLWNTFGLLCVVVLLYIVGRRVWRKYYPKAGL